MSRISSSSGIFMLPAGLHRGDIVAFAPGTWGWPEFAGSPRYHLWGLAGLGWRVLYVEPPKRLQLITRMWKAPDRDFHVLTPGLVAPFGVRLVPNEKTGDAWREKTAEGLLARANEAIKTLGFEPKIWWLGAPWHSVIARRLPKDDAKVAHVYDELSSSPALDATQRTLLWDWERELMRNIDVTLCSSEPQLSRRTRIAARLVLIENAVSEAHLPENRQPPSNETTVLAAKVAKLPHPRLLYGGTVDHRLDESIFTLLATSFPGGSLVFAGHLDDSFASGARKQLQSMKNVHFLGDVPYSAFPWLYSHADVLLLAHKRNEFTNAMYPEKLNEYLASGKPVVTVPLPEIGRITREGKGHLLRLAETPEQFIAAVADAAAEDNPALAEERIEFVRLNRTWAHWAGKVDRELLRLLRGKAG